jgi:uncharacterized membrane protein YgdD (TMEM256/DUF423 family)
MFEGTARLFAIIGALSGFLSVAAGAFGAHALRARLEPRVLEAFETGARYHMFHALALLFVAFLATRGGAAPRLAGWAFVTGIVLFSGSLYAYALSGVKGFAMITPVGGVAFLVGWVALIVAAARG